jgi:transposase
LARNRLNEAIVSEQALTYQCLLDAVETIGARPIIPQRSCFNRSRDFDATIYKRRNLIERTIGKLKQLRRITTRYDRSLRNLLAFLSLAAVTFWA